MKITPEQFEIYLREIPPVVWVWTLGKLEDGEAKSAMHKFLFDETSLRDLTKPWMKPEFDDIATRHPEVQRILFRAATDYYVKHSWRKWLPWNWNK